MHAVMSSAALGQQWAVLRMWGALLGADSRALLRAVDCVGLSPTGAIGVQVGRPGRDRRLTGSSVGALLHVQTSG